MITSSFRKLSVLLLCLSSLQASERVSVTFRVMSADSIAEPLAFHNGSSIQPLPVPNASKSIPYTYTGTRTLTLLKAVSSIQSQDVYQPVTEVVLPENISELLLIIKTEKDGAYSVFVDDDSLKTFPAGRYRVANLTQQEYTLSLGDTATEIKAGTTETLPPFGIGSAWTAVKISKLHEGRLRPLYSSRWTARPDSRTLILLYPADNAMGTSLKTIEERIAVP